jgi:hypothetical protein
MIRSILDKTMGIFAKDIHFEKKFDEERTRQQVLFMWQRRLFNRQE